MSKYYSKKTIIDGIKFASKKEAKRYLELKLLLKVGKIRDLILQPRFKLQEGFRKNGKTYYPVSYVADFQYLQNDMIRIEDVKGMKTTVYLLKKRLFEYKYPNLTIDEI